MSYVSGLWNRLEFEGLQIYVRTIRPCWFVPNKSGDRVLRKLALGADLDGTRFLERLPEGCKAHGGIALNQRDLFGLLEESRLVARPQECGRVLTDVSAYPTAGGMKSAAKQL